MFIPCLSHGCGYVMCISPLTTSYQIYGKPMEPWRAHRKDGSKALLPRWFMVGLWWVYGGFMVGLWWSMGNTSGWWLSLPLWTNSGVSFVSWDADIPNWMESRKIPWFQTTNQISSMLYFWIGMIKPHGSWHIPSRCDFAVMTLGTSSVTCVWLQCEAPVR